jgi:hypothetical protein
MNGNGAHFFTIRVQGHLDAAWSDWFDGMSITHDGEVEQAETALTGILADQAALYGVLTKVRDLNLTLVEVKRCAPVNP